MRFKIVGANAESGDDVDVLLEAPSQLDVERVAHDKGILVSTITALPMEKRDDPGAIALVDDEPAPPAPAAPTPAPHTAHAPHDAAAPNGSNGNNGNHTNHASQGAPAAHADAAHAGEAHPPHKERAHGVITTSANSPSDTAHSGDGHIAEGKHVDSPMEYHIIMNQSLYLLETAVNRHLKDGWEPTGGLSVGMSNNALQFFQSMTRKKKV